LSNVIETLAKLVSINSVNPEWDGPGEAGMVQSVTNFLEAAGITCETDEILPGRSNVMAHIPGRDSDRSVILEAHLDTVSTGGMTIPPFDPVVRDGRIYGRGSCDTKGGLAGMMHAFKWFSDTGTTPACDTYLAAVIDEEHAFRGVLGALDWLARHNVSPEAAVVAEPTNLRLVRANKGVLRWKIETRGKAAHSSKPHLGRNAITMMAEVIQKIERYHQTLAERSHPLLGAGTGSIGVIEGGEQINFVPSRCVISLDRRMLPGETEASVSSAYEDVLSDFSSDEITIHSADLVDEAMETPASASVVATGSAVLEGMGLDPNPCGVPFGCDVTKFSRAGIPGIIFGPGSIDQAHADVEYVDVNEVELGFEFYRRFLLNYAQ
tara:strand:+ start:2229 stop:3368 length:1140 start_codon:yes stop_codon:yes gene_type:complete